MNLTLFTGGKSFENEISILTAIQVSNELKSFNIDLIYITKENEFYYIKNDNFNFKYLKNIEQIPKKSKKVTLVNKGYKLGTRIVPIAMALNIGHGSYLEDGILHSMFKFYDIPFIGNNPFSQKMALDKDLMKRAFINNNINTLDFNVIRKYAFDIEKLKSEIEFPVILKPANLGSSIGIEVVHNKNEFKSKLKSSFRYDDTVIAEPFIEDFDEYNIALYSHKDKIYYSSIEKINVKDEIYSFEDKYTDKYDKEDRNIDNFVLSDELKDEILLLAKRAYNVFNLNFICRFDFIVKDNQVYLNELNTIPGGLSYYLFNESLDEIIKKLYKGAVTNQIKKGKLIKPRNNIFKSNNIMSK